VGEIGRIGLRDAPQSGPKFTGFTDVSRHIAGKMRRRGFIREFGR
jgi:hypothetical protein